MVEIILHICNALSRIKFLSKFITNIFTPFEENFEFQFKMLLLQNEGFEQVYHRMSSWLKFFLIWIKNLSKFTTEYFHHDEENFELLWSKMLQRWNWTSLSQNLLTKNEQYFNYLSKFITNLQHDWKNFWLLEMLRYEEFEQVLLRISSPWLKKVEFQVVPDQKNITGITVNTRINDHFLNCCEVIGRNTVLLKIL